MCAVGELLLVVVVAATVVATVVVVLCSAYSLSGIKPSWLIDEPREMLRTSAI